MSATITGVMGPHGNASFAIGEELTVGRDPANLVCIDDFAVSRRHCIIVHDGDRYRIRDMASHNGTFVNGQRVDESPLQNGDRIAVGSSIFEFAVENASVPVPAAVSFEDVPSPATCEFDREELMVDEDMATMSLPRQRLSHDFAVLLRVATKLRGIRETDALLWQLVGVLLDVIPAERVAILLASGGTPMEPAFAWDKITGPGQPVRVSRTMVDRAMTQQRSLLINDVPKFKGSTSMEQMGVHSVLCAPLSTPDQQLGAIYMDSRTLGSQFDAGHLHLLSAIAGVAALALENARFIGLLERENEQLKSEVRARFDMIGESTAMQEVYRFIAKVAPQPSNVLVLGESGTGKELVARAIHGHSPRASGAFVAINCAAITETLLESELFGHEKGAFTGATAQKRGYLETANGGTVFLDEIGELALPLQAKLLRVLQERELIRVGGTRPIKVDIRVVAATNKSLAERVKQGQFREDLFYRLNVLSCKVPPLRARREDIPLLAHHFVESYSQKCNRKILGISPEAVACMQKYDWPGNVRELENAIEHAVVLGSTTEIVRDDLPESLLEAAGPAGSGKYHEEVTRKKKELVTDALKRTDGHFTEAAKLLGVHPNYLHRLVRVLELRSEIKKSGT